MVNIWCILFWSYLKQSLLPLKYLWLHALSIAWLFIQEVPRNESWRQATSAWSNGVSAWDHPSAYVVKQGCLWVRQEWNVIVTYYCNFGNCFMNIIINGGEKITNPSTNTIPSHRTQGLQLHHSFKKTAGYFGPVRPFSKIDIIQME